ncbi:hypothetical protein SB861_61320, partial [Paraburkholderia sp. SIMBA_049]
RIRDMGFDVLYFPPIHPIGLANRKGRNNTLNAQPGDVGSPYAIGAAEGGQIGNNVNLRGFTAQNDIYLDGFRDRNQYYRDTFDLEQLEVL